MKLSSAPPNVMFLNILRWLLSSQLLLEAEISNFKILYILRFQIANFNGLWRLLLLGNVVTEFFGGYGDPIEHIGEEKPWLGICSQFGPNMANMPILYNHIAVNVARY